VQYGIALIITEHMCMHTHFNSPQIADPSGFIQIYVHFHFNWIN